MFMNVLNCLVLLELLYLGEHSICKLRILNWGEIGWIYLLGDWWVLVHVHRNSTVWTPLQREIQKLPEAHKANTQQPWYTLSFCSPRSNNIRYVIIIICQHTNVYTQLYITYFQFRCLPVVCHQPLITRGVPTWFDLLHNAAIDFFHCLLNNSLAVLILQQFSQL